MKKNCFHNEQLEDNYMINKKDKEIGHFNFCGITHKIGESCHSPAKVSKCCGAKPVLQIGTRNGHQCLNCGKPFEIVELNLASQFKKDEKRTDNPDISSQSIEERWAENIRNTDGAEFLEFNSASGSRFMNVEKLISFIRNEINEARKQGEKDGWKQGELHGIALGKGTLH